MRRWQGVLTLLRPGGKLALVLSIALTAILTAVATERAHSKKPQPGAPLPSVIAVQVQREDVPLMLQAIGTVTPLATVTLRSQISGYLQQLTPKEGQLVRKGDFLAQIDPRPYEASLEQAQGQLIRDTALLKNAQIDFARYQRLIAQDSASHQALDTAAATVSQYEGLVRSDRAQVATQRLNLEYCRLRAPVDGLVGLHQVDPGNFIQATDTTGILVITQLQPISVLFILPQTEVGAVIRAVGSEASLSVDALEASSATVLASGELVSVDNQIDVSTGTVKLRAVFPNTDRRLYPNQFVNVQLRVHTLKQALTVPTRAVRQTAIGSTVWVLDDRARVHSRPVTTGPEYAGKTVIISGLAPTERILTDGFSQVDEGVRVSTHTDITGS